MAFEKIKKLLKIGKYNTKIQNSFNRLISLDGPLISNFGKDIYVSDIVKTAVHRIAEEVSKSYLRSVIQKVSNSGKIKINDDDYNFIFTTRFNRLMTSHDFMYKLGYMLVKNCNAYIYQTFDEVPIKGTDLVKRVPKEFYILDPDEVTIYELDGEFRIELIGNGVTFDLPYEDIIHVRWKFGEHSTKGGDANGKFDVRALLGNLQILHTIKECVPKSMVASLSIKGLLSMKTVADADKKTLRRDEFENHILDSKYGILATDFESDFTPININASDIPSNVLNFVKDELLYPFGVSLPILTGKFTDDEYSAFYQTTIEGILVAISEAFTVGIFTQKQLRAGYKIKVYDRFVQSLSFATRMKIVELANPSNLLKRMEQRELLGYEPDEDPDRVSLNYIDTSIANQYQLIKKTIKKEDDENA